MADRPSDPISRVVITTAEGERTIEFKPAKRLDDIGEAELGAMIGDIMAFPVGYGLLQQVAAKEVVGPAPE